MLLELLAQAKVELPLILAIDDLLPEISQQRIKNNIPAGLDCTVVAIPNIPEFISPQQSQLLTIGLYGGCNLALLPHSTRKLLNFYRGVFFGEYILLNPLAKALHNRAQGWVSVYMADYFTDLGWQPDDTHPIWSTTQ